MTKSSGSSFPSLALSVPLHSFNSHSVDSTGAITRSFFIERTSCISRQSSVIYGGVNSWSAFISCSRAGFNTEAGVPYYGHREHGSFRGVLEISSGGNAHISDSCSGPHDLGIDGKEVSKSSDKYNRFEDSGSLSFASVRGRSLSYGRRKPPSILDRYTIPQSVSTHFNSRTYNRTELALGHNNHPGHDGYSKDASTVSPFRNATVSVFWDLDNKPPKSSPYDAARHLRETASQFGFVMEVVAYANRHAFTHVPGWVRDERRERKQLDLLEQKGIVGPEQPYVCDVCGRKCKTNVLLRKHFIQLHQREQNKRMNRLNSLKGKKRDKFKQSIAPKSIKYKEAARPIIKPKVGYGLESDLRRAGVTVKTVQYKPQAADMALKKQVANSINKGVKCLCLVSDDTDFAEMLRDAKALDLRTVVVGESKSLKRFADLWLPWDDVSRGLQTYNCQETIRYWTQQHNASRYHKHDQLQTHSKAAYASGYGIDNEYSAESEVQHMTFLGSSLGPAMQFPTSSEKRPAVFEDDVYGFSADDDDDVELSLEDDKEDLLLMARN